MNGGFIVSEDTNKENAAEEAVTEYKIKVYDTITKTKKDVEVSKDVYNEYRRGEWRIDKNNMKNLKRMIPFSALLSKEGDIDDFDEFIDHSNNPEEIYCEEQEFYNPISCLKESDIELLDAIYRKKMTKAEYARKVGLTRQAVGQRLERILKKLKNFCNYSVPHPKNLIDLT